MKSLIKNMNFTLLFLLAGMCIADFSQAVAQDRIPREYTNPDEVISFDRRTSFPEALDVLNLYAQDFENRFIIDQSGYTGPIGVSLPAMHWREALDYILRVQDLVLLESPDFLEIVTQQAADEMFAEETASTTPRPTGGGQRSQEDELGLKINTGTREVRINATFFEGSKRALREIGVDWSTLTNTVPANISDFLGDDGNEDFPTSQFGDAFVNVNSTAAQNVSQNVFNAIVNFGEVADGVEVQALFSAFEADNLGKILATPSIKVLNGEEGRIQVGQDFSIKQRDFAGNVTDQFFSTGTILSVTPQIVEYGDTTLVYLDLQSERSTAQPDPVSTIINKQQANTHALLLDGESTVIAGLYRNEEATIRRGIPILKDLPGWFFGLKYLFGYNSTDVQESELIILLQAELEDPIPVRAARRFRSQQELFDDQRTTHRLGLDRQTENSLAAGPVSETVTVVEDESPGITEPIFESDQVTEEETVIELEPPVTETKDVDIDELRAEIERRRLTEGQVSQTGDISQYAGEWRTMELENMNGDYDSLNFYVIGGSFQVKENADRLYAAFKNEGLEAHMLFNPVTDFYFVAYAGFENPEEAVPYLREVQRTRQQEAWISRIMRKERRLDLNGN
ncbi:MAG: SPOR domain-containing protein [Balneolaceae bacterium]